MNRKFKQNYCDIEFAIPIYELLDCEFLIFNSIYVLSIKVVELKTFNLGGFSYEFCIVDSGI